MWCFQDHLLFLFFKLFRLTNTTPFRFLRLENTPGPPVLDLRASLGEISAMTEVEEVTNRTERLD